MPSDYYDILGVSRTATESDIKQAYRRLARTYHPDVAEDKVQAEARFKEINEAYAVLSDPQQRETYDRFGHAGMPGAGGGGAGFAPEGFGDIFEMFFGGMRAGAGGARRGTNAAPRGADLRYDLELTLEEAYLGVEREISFQHLAACDTCRGSGAKAGTQVVPCILCHGSGLTQSVRTTPLGRFVTQAPCGRCNGEGHVIPTPCETCRGQGRIERRRVMSVTIPPGVDDGSRIRIANNGEAAPRGGAPGDLYVYLTMRPHDIFTRDGADLSMRMPISFPQAALGAQVEVRSLSDEPLTLDVHPGTQSGTRYRLRGHGMPTLRGGHGDLYVTVQVEVPTRLAKRERELLEELSTLRGDMVDERSFFERVKDAFRPE